MKASRGTCYVFGRWQDDKKMAALARRCGFAAELIQDVGTDYDRRAVVMSDDLAFLRHLKTSGVKTIYVGAGADKANDLEVGAAIPALEFECAMHQFQVLGFPAGPQGALS